jgi:hypothetical protein
MVKAIITSFRTTETWYFSSMEVDLIWDERNTYRDIGLPGPKNNKIRSLGWNERAEFSRGDLPGPPGAAVVLALRNDEKTLVAKHQVIYLANGD